MSGYLVAITKPEGKYYHTDYASYKANSEAKKKNREKGFNGIFHGIRI